MDEEQRKLEHYKLIFAHFSWIEQRYHIWMNYYSLFDGALLVAYCTILASKKWRWKGIFLIMGLQIWMQSYSI